MYHSNPLYTGNTGLSNCILGMSNLTAGIHIHNMVQFGKEFPQIFSLFVGRNTLAFVQMSETRVVHEELGANSTSLQ